MAVPRELKALVGQPVIVVRSGDPTQRGRFVVASAHGTVAVLVPDDPEARALAARTIPGEAIEVGAGTAAGWMAAPSRVQRWSSSNRMLMVDNPWALAVENRREHYRVDVAVPVWVVVPVRSGVQILHGATLNLSAGGLALRADDGAALPDPGREVAVGLGLGSAQVLAVAKVLARSEAARADLRGEFTQILEADRDLVAAFVQRQGSQRTRTS